MNSEQKPLSKSILNLYEFMDFSEWIGRVPSSKSTDKYERRLSFWLIHMKQAKKGKSTCLWRDEMEQIADSKGYKGLFTDDNRKYRFFDLSGKKIAGYEVLEKADVLSNNNQVQWVCMNGTEKAVTLSAYKLMRIRDKPSYSEIESATSHLIGKNVGCFKLLGIYDFCKDDRTIWYVSSDSDGISFVNRIELPTLQSLTRYVNSIENKNPEQLNLGFGAEDMTAQKIGRWTVIGPSKKASYNNEWMWDCVCDCGAFSIVAGAKLRNGSSLSCGCLRRTLLNQAEIGV